MAFRQARAIFCYKLKSTPMELPSKALKELQQIYKKEFNIDMTGDKAEAEARRILIFFHTSLVWLQNHNKQKSEEQTEKIVENKNKLPGQEKGQLKLF